MKKLTMALVAVMALASCGKTAAPVETPVTTETPAAAATGTTETPAAAATGAAETPAASTGAAQ